MPRGVAEASQEGGPAFWTSPLTSANLKVPPHPDRGICGRCAARPAPHKYLLARHRVRASRALECVVMLRANRLIWRQSQPRRDPPCRDRMDVLRATLTSWARRTVQPLASPGLCRYFGLGLALALSGGWRWTVYGGGAGPSTVSEASAAAPNRAGPWCPQPQGMTRRSLAVRGLSGSSHIVVRRSRARALDALPDFVG